ncbi:MAG: hypothetical protein WDO73_08125 [Ignavibacteriota bacterium]
MKLRYVVITIVNRDDLADGGSAHFAATVREVRRALPEARVEVLTSPISAAISTLWPACWTPVPTSSITIWRRWPRLYKRVRPQADYRQSLDVLHLRAAISPALTKSGFMVGLGETEEEVQPCCGTSTHPAPMPPPSANTCSRRAAICPWRSTLPPAQFDRYRELRASPWASKWSSAARWCAVRT